MPVAEGPLIRHVPGGTAEWRAKETGLPPARLVKSEDEWWGQLVQPTGGEIGAGGIGDVSDVGVDKTDMVGGAFTKDEMQGMDETAFQDKLREELNREHIDITPEQFDLPKIWEDTDLYWKPKDTDAGYKLPDFLTEQHGNITGAAGGALPRTGGLAGGGLDPRLIPQPSLVPGGQADRLITGRGPVGAGKPLVEFQPSPTEYAKGYDPSKTFYERPGVQQDIEEVIKDTLSFGDRAIRVIAGPTATEFHPRNENESKLFKQFERGYELFKAWMEETGGVFGGTLYETGGGRTTTPEPTTPFGTKTEVPQAHFLNIFKTLGNFLAGKEDPIVMQKYGDFHWLTIATTIGLANTYGPIVWAIPGLRTMADTIKASMNGMFMDKPNLEGNPIQDTLHTAFWIFGKSAEKLWEISAGKIAEKLRGKPKGEKTERGTILEEFEKKIANAKDTFKAPPSRRIKIKLDPEFESAGQRHLQPDHDPLISETIGTKLAPGTPGTPTREMRKPVPTGEPSTAQPIRVEVPAEREPIIQGPTGTSGYTQIPTEVGQAAAKTITGPLGEFPAGKAVTTDILPSSEVRISEGDPLGAGITPRPKKDETGDDDEKGKGLDQPSFSWLPVDSFGNQYGEAGFNANDIVGIEYRPHWPKEGEGEEFENEASRLGDEWKATQETQAGGIVAETGDQDFRSQQQKDLGLTIANEWLDENDQSTWRAIQATQTDQYNPRTGQFDLQYNRNLPESTRPDHPQYYQNNPDWVGNQPESTTTGGGYAETDFDEGELRSKWPGTQSKFWYGHDTEGNSISYGLEIRFKKMGTGSNATYYYRYSSPEEAAQSEGIQIDRSSSDSWDDTWQEWIPGP